MFNVLIDKISNIIHKERNKKLKEIQQYLETMNIKATLYPREKVIEFNKKQITKIYCTADYFQYHFDDETLTFSARFYDNQGWLKSLMDSKYNTPRLQSFYKSILNNHVSHKKGFIYNKCINLELMKSDSFVVQITKNSLKLIVHLTAKKNNAVDFYIEMVASFDKNKITVNYAPDGGDIDKTVDMDNDCLDEIQNELTGQYLIHFLTDYGKYELLEISETNPYNPEFHNELIKMYTI